MIVLTGIPPIPILAGRFPSRLKKDHGAFALLPLHEEWDYRLFLVTAGVCWEDIGQVGIEHIEKRWAMIMGGMYEKKRAS
jgi:hypothetical protein